MGRMRGTLPHVILAAAIGSALEWYDFFIYGTAAALVFGELFFPEFDPRGRHPACRSRPSASALSYDRSAASSSAISATASAASRCWWRPCWWSGRHLPDRILPTYAPIGIWAPLLLVLMRLMQGFGAGAEYGGAVILLVEYAPPRTSRPLGRLRAARRHCRQSARGRRVRAGHDAAEASWPGAGDSVPAQLVWCSSAFASAPSVGDAGLPRGRGPARRLPGKTRRSKRCGATRAISWWCSAHASPRTASAISSRSSASVT